MWQDEESICTLLSQKNINVDIQDDIGFAPIHVASRVNCISILNRLIDARAHLHPRTMQGWTPLHVASMSGSLEAVKRLLELDLDIYAEDKEGRTPSDLADECGRSDVYWHFIKKAGQEEKSTLTLPLKSGNRYNWEERLLNWTRQGEERYINLVKYNQPEPYDGHFQDSKGYTTLHIAADMGNFNFVRVLVEDCRTFAAALNWQNQTPADLARANGYGDIAEYLDNAVQQPKTAKEAENLYLQLLETIGKGDDVRRAANLLFQGAPLEPTGQHSTNALILAVTTNRRRILTLLIAAGAPITTVFQEHNILQIAWLSPNISTFIRMIITRAIGYILEIELMMLDPCETELQEGIYALLKCIRSNKPWTARWPNTTQKLDFIKQRSCRNEPEIKENSESSYHLSYLMRKAVQFGAKLTTAFLQQAGGITFVNDANMEGSPFTLAIKFKHWIIVNQMAKSSACLYMPDVQGQLPKDHLPPQRRRILENEICDKETRKIEHEKDKARDNEVKRQLQKIQELQGKLFRIYSREEGIDKHPFLEEYRSIYLKAFHLASYLGLSQMVYLLLTVLHLDINYELEPLMGSTALHQAAAYGHDDLCALLIKNGASLNQTDKFLHTPPHFAAMFGHNVAYNLLISLTENSEQNQTNNTPHCVQAQFCHLLHQYNITMDIMCNDDEVYESNDPGEAARKLLEKLTLKNLVENSRMLCVDFSGNEEAEIKLVITQELENLMTSVAYQNSTYKGSLELLGSAQDNTRLYAPDEFDFNLCIDMTKTVKVEIIEFEETEACLKGHPKDLIVTSDDPQVKFILEEQNWKNNFHDAVVRSLEKHPFSDKRLTLVPPGVTRTQVGIGISLSWQGEKYPLLLIGVDIVPVMKVDWPESIHKPFLSPKDASHIYLSDIGEGMWRLSLAYLESSVLQSLKLEERTVYMTCKTLLSSMKAEPWMPKAVKNKYTWWNARRWKIPVPSGFALKNCFLRQLEEKKRNDIKWDANNLAKCMLHVFELMAEKEVHKKTNKVTMVSKKIYPYFGGEFEKAKLGEGSLEILKFLEQYT
ncbi:hypothetical protein SK128_010910 [Halocaridina rubra]|uniref:Uncharacterized protein n=1 Tax=Halocaridina rubra TaxID=373956 RepID=A0AAN8XQ61_HALRR